MFVFLFANDCPANPALTTSRETECDSPSPIRWERAGVRERPDKNHSTNDMAQVQSFLTGNGDERQTLVVVFLRGGADGLNLVAPLEDDGYYRSRPRIAISKQTCVPLDGFYGLNPLLKSLKPAYKDGALAIVHAAGSLLEVCAHLVGRTTLPRAMHEAPSAESTARTSTGRSISRAIIRDWRCSATRRSPGPSAPAPMDP